MTENMQWIIYGGVVTTLVGFFTYMVQKSLSRCWEGVHSAIFQLISKRFDLAEVTVRDTGCEQVFARILWQIGLDTRRYIYIHDANATSGDEMMVGCIRLPTRSWLLWLLALLEISHFIWIKDNVKHITYVGPRIGFERLLHFANKTKNRSLSIDEINDIKTALDGDSTTIAACIFYERGILVLTVAFTIAWLVQSQSISKVDVHVRDHGQRRACRHIKINTMY